VTTDYQTALESDPHKKGVKLYQITQCDDIPLWVWARTPEQALAAVAKSRGFGATLHRLGVAIDNNFNVEGLASD
jgi:hypothetical protein